MGIIKIKKYRSEKLVEQNYSLFLHFVFRTYTCCCSKIYASEDKLRSLFITKYSIKYYKHKSCYFLKVRFRLYLCFIFKFFANFIKIYVILIMLISVLQNKNWFKSILLF